MSPGRPLRSEPSGIKALMRVSTTMANPTQGSHGVMTTAMTLSVTTAYQIKRAIGRCAPLARGAGGALVQEIVAGSASHDVKAVDGFAG